MKIYVTHCTYKKDDSLRGTGKLVFPDELYVGKRIQGFMGKCKAVGAYWGIFSDYHGMWFCDERKGYYDNAEGDPNSVDEQRFQQLLTNFDERLANYDDIFFYCNYNNPRRFHRIYRCLLEETSLRHKLRIITRLAEIVSLCD